MASQAEILKTDMESTVIPGTSLKVSRVAIGTWAIGGWMWGGTVEAESIATIRAAVEHGINVIDTAPVYGFGRQRSVSIIDPYVVALILGSLQRAPTWVRKSGRPNGRYRHSGLGLPATSVPVHLGTLRDVLTIYFLTLSNALLKLSALISSPLRSAVVKSGCSTEITPTRPTTLGSESVTPIAR